MKKHTLFTIGLFMLLISFWGARPSRAQETQPADAPTSPADYAGTAFTYQGQLTQNSSPVSGVCDMNFSLFDSLAGAGQISVTLPKTVTVSEGKFTTQLDFGELAFTGEGRWLEIAVRCPAGSGSYITLTPRQPLTPAPLAFALRGLYTIETQYSPIIIGGYNGNSVALSAYGSTIAGGGESTGCGVSGTDSCANTIAETASFATISGGKGNQITYYALNATIGGGAENRASDFYTTVSGGYRNLALLANSTVSGGYVNSANGAFSTIPGGEGNVTGIAGGWSFAAGHYAEAANLGSFVWADASDQADPLVFASNADNQFLIKAAGGVGIGTNNTLANGLTVNGQVIAGDTAINATGGEPFLSRGANSGISLDDRTNGASERWVIFPNAGVLNFFHQGVIQASLSSAGVLTIGALGNAGGTPVCRNASNQLSDCSSSLRYKTDVAPLAKGLDVVEQLRPVTFAWKETGEADLGLVAEEVSQVAPLLTTYNDEGQIEGVKYDRLGAVLVKAVQEQQAQIAALEAQLAQYKQDESANGTQGATPSFLSLAAAAIGLLLVIVILQSLFLWRLVLPRLQRRGA